MSVHSSALYPHSSGSLFCGYSPAQTTQCQAAAWHLAAPPAQLQTLTAMGAVPWASVGTRYFPWIYEHLYPLCSYIPIFWFSLPLHRVKLTQEFAPLLNPLPTVSKENQFSSLVLQDWNCCLVFLVGGSLAVFISLWYGRIFIFLFASCQTFYPQWRWESRYITWAVICHLQKITIQPIYHIFSFLFMDPRGCSVLFSFVFFVSVPTTVMKWHNLSSLFPQDTAFARLPCCNSLSSPFPGGMLSPSCSSLYRTACQTVLSETFQLSYGHREGEQDGALLWLCSSPPLLCSCCFSLRGLYLVVGDLTACLLPSSDSQNTVQCRWRSGVGM